MILAGFTKETGKMIKGMVMDLKSLLIRMHIMGSIFQEKQLEKVFILGEMVNHIKANFQKDLKKVMAFGKGSKVIHS